VGAAPLLGGAAPPSNTLSTGDIEHHAVRLPQLRLIIILLAVYNLQPKIVVIYLLWPPYGIGLAIIFSSCGFFFRLLISSFVSSHDVALVRICNSCLKCVARSSLKIQGAKIAKNSPSAHNRTTLPACIFAIKACIDNRKNMLNTNISSTCSYNNANGGPLAA